jgi:signal transduction histidine kinase
MHREKIFGLYQRFHENHSGNGLGLFMIKSQINALNSQIEVESEVGKGTSFIITFKSLNNLQVYGMNKAQVENSKALANA